MCVSGGGSRGETRTPGLRHFHLERDHIDPLAGTGITELDNLDWRCPHCHKLKTKTDRKNGRLNPNNSNPPGKAAEQPTLTGRGPP